ncbi:ubiquitin-conjugating enzyme E2 W isoform X5 [Canis aureus]
MTLNEKSVQNSITQWIVDMEGAPGTLYEGEKFQLLFKFSSRYPFDSPQVMFTGENIPVHPHVYSNGHICLSILTEDWSPALSVQSVCLSIISMLSSCKEKRRPPDNSFYVRTCNKNPKKTKWWYHGHPHLLTGPLPTAACPRNTARLDVTIAHDCLGVSSCFRLTPSSLLLLHLLTPLTCPESPLKLGRRMD